MICPPSPEGFGGIQIHEKPLTAIVRGFNQHKPQLLLTCWFFLF
jgi:hypothetical protein